jgi:hypothetical protein
MPTCSTRNSPDRNTELSLGFALAFGTRNTLGTGCNDLVSAETLMMINERFIEGFGMPKFTIGSGGSGGAMQQRLIVQNYPGLLDAIMTARPPRRRSWRSSKPPAEPVLDRRAHRVGLLGGDPVHGVDLDDVAVGQGGERAARAPGIGHAAA